MTKPTREKEIEKVNGWRKENDTWRGGGEAIPLSVSFFPFSHPVVTHSPTSFSFPFIFSYLRHSSPVHHACDPTRTGTRTRNASCPWPPRSRDDCNLHKLSFRFDDDIAETTAVKKRIGNDWTIEFFALRTLDRRDTESSF